ncbi:MAG: HAMP domain-containing sensor histidine kinase [Bacillota bacterium]|nr:HAMP domain-containing sensor histidine kinase [Bacillota bacterium]
MAATREDVRPVQTPERLAHDLCNYLTAISGLAQVGLLVQAGEAKDSYLYRIETAVQEMAVMLRDMLTDQTRDPREELEPGGMRRLLRDVADLLVPRFEQKGVGLTVDCPAVFPRIRLAPMAFKQVLVNLLDNALYFTPCGGSVTLTAASSRRPPQAVIRVQDTGTGIPKDVLAKVWQPGYTTRSDGYGLGLSTAREIIEVLHGGRLSLRSKPGGGTTVRICLPC